MIRRFLLIATLLLIVPGYVFAQQAESPSDSSSNAAHGSEKVGHEATQRTEGHDEHHHEKIYFGFMPAWLLKLINMVVFLGILGYLVAGPVKKAFADRSDAIRKAAEEARMRRQKSEQLATDIQARLTQIEQEVQSIHDRAFQEGERQKKELIAAAEAEAQKILQAARNEVDNRLKHARHELTEYAGQLASERAESLLREKITAADQHKLFEDSVREVAEVKG